MASRNKQREIEHERWVRAAAHLFGLSEYAARFVYEVQMSGDGDGVVLQVVLRRELSLEEYRQMRAAYPDATEGGAD
jgi:hypothetical protein